MRPSSQAIGIVLDTLLYCLWAEGWSRPPSIRPPEPFSPAFPPPRVVGTNLIHRQVTNNVPAAGLGLNATLGELLLRSCHAEAIGRALHSTQNLLVRKVILIRGRLTLLSQH